MGVARVYVTAIQGGYCLMQWIAVQNRDIQLRVERQGQPFCYSTSSFINFLRAGGKNTQLLFYIVLYFWTEALDGGETNFYAFIT